MKPNIFWILTDSIRNKPGKDNFGRLKTYYDFDKDSIRFKQAISSAPATIMSMCATATGRFSVGLYPDFGYVMTKGIVYPTYLDAIKKAGYNVASAIYDSGAGRKLFQNKFNTHIISPDHINTTKGMFEEFLYLMKNHFNPDKPNFIFVHTGPFEDNDTYVPKIFEYLKKQNLYNDAIVIMSSDHGYVDYGRFHYFGWALQPRTHSFYVDSNTYLANLNIRLPSSLSNVRTKEIDVPVCLFDILETVCDYTKIPFGAENKKAVSLKRLIETNDEKIKDIFNKRMLRVDSRYYMQNHKRTALIDGHSVHFVSDDKDIQKLPEKFKKFLETTDEDAKKSIFKLISEEYDKSEISNIKNKKIVLYNYCHNDLLSYVKNRLSVKNVVSILDLKNIKKDYRKYEAVIAIVNNSQFYGYSRLVSFCKKKNINLILLDTMFREKKYVKYEYLKETLNDPAIKKSRYGFIVNCALYVMLLGIRIYETLLLDKPINYHPVVKNL
ncbi:TPA: hypothetical protein HA219_02210 [Candidatus Woesearchaeota archaeon]|nr:hypothetical protein [Candidatus Woesearchaeota archaeon]HIH39514.1 hypothetical protein [Candidatus Woesearchaeota archaeon]